MIKAPWTIDQVKRMNRWQRFRHVPRIDCPNAAEHKFNIGLIAGLNALFCPYCDYRSEYAPEYMFMPVPKVVRFDNDEKTPGSE
jgi:hypothetical protein